VCDIVVSDLFTPRVSRIGVVVSDLFTPKVSRIGVVVFLFVVMMMVMMMMVVLSSMSFTLLTSKCLKAGLRG